MKKIYILFIATVSLLTASSALAANASLYLSPSAGNYTVGNTFLVEVKVNSGGVPINAADGTLIFDPDKLEVKSISKEGSVFSLWVQDPIFSNSLGTINFAGGKPSPGFTGAAGKVINIIFKARTSGQANLSFAAGSVLADDGKGTNILASMGAGVYTLSAKEITPIPPGEEYFPSPTPSGVPLAPIIFSLTHPEENKWYSDNDPQFSWQLPSDVTGVSLLLHQKSTADPGPQSDGLLTVKSYENVVDGVWYFHIKFRNQYGWSEITHRKVLIDTVPPEPFKIIFDNLGDPTNPTPVFNFQTTDLLSGLEYYEVIIEHEEGTITDTANPKNIKDNPYQPLPLPPGEHKFIVQAYDAAGNAALAETEFEISPIPTPKITKIPISIMTEDVLEVEGETQPEFTVRIYIQPEGEESFFERVWPDTEGKFKLSYNKVLAKGDYLIWARAENEAGALSYPTQKYSLEVGLTPFLKIGKIALDYLTTMLTLIILIIGAIAIGFYAWYRISLWRKRLREETKEVAENVTKAFRALREEVQEQIEYLDEQPGLTKAEKKVQNKLKEALNVSEEFIKKELKDIEKELE